jgi:hypothetical protein
VVGEKHHGHDDRGDDSEKMATPTKRMSGVAALSPSAAREEYP